MFEIKPQNKPKLVRPRSILLHMDKGKDVELHVWLKQKAASSDVSMAELCRQMLRHCAAELGFGASKEERQVGEYADLFLDGIVDEETGEVIDGEAPGYPRSPTREARNKPHICPECEKRFRTRQGVEDHARDKHGIS